MDLLNDATWDFIVDGGLCNSCVVCVVAIGPSGSRLPHDFSRDRIDSTEPRQPTDYQATCGRRWVLCEVKAQATTDADTRWTNACRLSRAHARRHFFDFLRISTACTFHIDSWLAFWMHLNEWRPQRRLVALHYICIVKKLVEPQEVDWLRMHLPAIPEKTLRPVAIMTGYIFHSFSLSIRATNNSIHPQSSHVR